MFFPRLRKQAKWVFLFLALAFALGFIGFGVGAGGVGVADTLRGLGVGSGIPSVSEAQERVAENPDDPEALRELANAYRARGDTREAIATLEGLVELRPKDEAALRELASLQLTLATEAEDRAQILQYRQSFLAPAADVFGFVLLDGRPLDPDPITNAVSSGYDDRIASAYNEARSAAASAVETFKRLAAASPNDPSVQLELAQAATSAGDAKTAIEAYERFLKLAPDDPTAPEVRRVLKQLRQQAGTRS
ncbi:MAG: tetratricopeptide repeat protein [Gaiellaceae bacterium]|nr:tetratricopeptide repeat protein [Gaiellaceae bacterium]